MQLVVDTNVLISALIARSKTFEIIVLGDLELFAPEYALGEIDRHKEELRARMDISQEEFNVVLNLILSHVVVVSRERYESFEAHAQKICPDQKDFPFFALALALKVPFWTNEVRLKNQREIAIYNTKELIDLMV